MMNLFSGSCTVCGGKNFLQGDVLWKELIDAWQLSTNEAAYINRQQGYHCIDCLNNLRSLSLAAAILCEYEFDGTLKEFVDVKTDLRVLEINRAGNLTPFFEMLRHHRLIEYPNYDMHDLGIDSDTFDLVVHSDTLEHIKNPARGLSECKRVLRKNGRCIFTIPIIVDRFSRSREGLTPSHHGNPSENPADQVVWTEFGVDAWKTVLEAGFNSCEIYSFEYPAAMTLIARKR